MSISVRPRLLLGLLLLALLALSLPAARVAGRAATRQAFVPGELVVQLRRPMPATVAGVAPQSGVATVDALMRRFGVSAAEPLATGAAASAAGLDRIYRLRLAPGADAWAAAWAFAANPHVEFAEPNYIYQASQAPPLPDDPGLILQWGLNNTGQTGGTSDADIDAPEAWAITTGSDAVMVAVVDTGIAYNHPDLDDGRVRTDIDVDLVNNDLDAMDDNEHGTHVAGIIAAETNNATGVAGVMHEAQLLPVKVLNANGSGSLFGVARGIAYAAAVGAHVINLSLGGPICAQALASAVNYAVFSEGTTVVAATGNNNGRVSFPARFAAVIAVAATDHNDRRASFSNYGLQVDVAAPGVDVISTVPGGRYAVFSGTSMAAPHVAGVAGLLLANRPDLTNLQVAQILRTSADDRGRPGFDIGLGAGRVNAYQALLTEAPTTVPTPPQAGCARVAGFALADAADAPDLTALADGFHDVALASPHGQALADRFDRHTPELLGMLLADGGLRTQTQETVRALRPALLALAGEGPEVTVSPEMAEALQGLIAAYAAQAGPELRADLEALAADLAAAEIAGKPAAAAWASLAQDTSVYLPLLIR